VTPPARARSRGSRSTRAAILAVDAGGSKVDAALVRADGTVLSTARLGIEARRPGGDARDGGRTSSRDGDFVEVTRSVASAVAIVAERAGRDPDRRPIATHGSYCLAGADFPQDDRRFAAAFRRQGWTAETTVANDSFAILRAGTERDWGVAVVCGFGTNCAGVAPNGRTYRLPARGTLSGDWGGGSDLGNAALWHALRAEDGRGAPTMLAELVPAHFGMRRPRQVMEAMHFGRMREDRRSELTPVLFRAAIEGDTVARRIVDRQADEIVTMAAAAIRRLRMTRLDVDVVLGGGVFRARDAAFFDRITRGVLAVAPLAHVKVVEAPPLVGAVLLALDRTGARRSAADRVRGALTHERLSAET
jgi:N-acetylglucosamine kinase-like BadF-type ATPase